MKSLAGPNEKRKRELIIRRDTRRLIGYVIRIYTFASCDTLTGD